MNRNLSAQIAAKAVHAGAVDAFTSKMVKTTDIDSLAFLISVDSAAVIDAANKLVFSFEESEDDTTYVAAPSTSQYPSQVELNNAAQAGKVVVVEYRGTAKHVKLVAAKTGAPTGDLSVLALSLHPATKPAVADIM